jgi:hypothetical protein
MGVRGNGVRGTDIVPDRPVTVFAALTLTGVKLVLQELAAFHASGMHFIRTYPGGIQALESQHRDTFTQVMWVTESEAGRAMSQNFLDMMFNIFGSCVLVCKQYAPEDLANRCEC